MTPEEAVLRLKGAPRQKSRSEWRWGSKGSFVYYVERRRWWDYEAGVGGDLAELVVRKRYAQDRKEAWVWLNDGRVATTPPPAHQEKPVSNEERIALARVAGAIARQWVRLAVIEEHEYLARKGFPEERGLVLEERLIVPMWRGQQIVAVQAINADGAKKTLPKNSMVSGARFIFGKNMKGPDWWCEGYASALSVRAALRRLYRNDDVVGVMFSAHAIREAPGLVIADHDWTRCRSCKHQWDAGVVLAERCPVCDSEQVTQSAGTRYALESGQRFWQPPEVGTDVNDFHQQNGLDALCDALRGVIMEGR